MSMQKTLHSLALMFEQFKHNFEPDVFSAALTRAWRAGAPLSANAARLWALAEHRYLGWCTRGPNTLPSRSSGPRRL